MLRSFVLAGVDIAAHFTSQLLLLYQNFPFKGFFAVYKKVFDTLAREDYDFIEDPTVHYPSFGDASSDYNTVLLRTENLFILRRQHNNPANRLTNRCL